MVMTDKVKRPILGATNKGGLATEPAATYRYMGKIFTRPSTDVRNWGYRC